MGSKPSAKKVEFATYNSFFERLLSRIDYILNRHSGHFGNQVRKIAHPVCLCHLIYDVDTFAGLGRIFIASWMHLTVSWM